MTWDGSTLTLGSSAYLGTTLASDLINTSNTAYATANSASGTATSAYNNATAASGVASAAQIAANTANDEIAIIVSDAYLSKDEKPAIIREVDAITGEYTDTKNKGDALSVSTADYTTKYTNLTTYLATLTPAYSSTSTNTAVNATNFKNAFVDYYTARQLLLNAISAKAATLSTWSGISSVPANVSNATTNRIFRQVETPSGTMYTGDIWYKFAGANEAASTGRIIATYTYDGTQWVRQYRAPITTSKVVAAGATVWSDTDAGTAITDAGGGTWSPGDVVTLYNSTRAETRMLVAGSAGWVTLAAKIDGNLLVTGSVSAGSIYASTLSAITADLGLVTAGAVYGGSMQSNGAWPASAATANGYYVGLNGIRFGNNTKWAAGGANNGSYFEVNLDGSIGTPRFRIDASGNVDIKGADFTTGTSPTISGTTMTGSGAVIKNDGTFALGGTDSNITGSGSVIYLNGPVVQNGNIVSNAVTTAKVLSENITVLRSGSQSPGFIHIPIGTTPTYPYVITSASIISTGAPIIINASCLYTANLSNGSIGTIRFSIRTSWYSFTNILLESRSFACKQPHDGIFGILTMPTSTWTAGATTATVSLCIEDDDAGGSGTTDRWVVFGSVTLLEVKR